MMIADQFQVIHVHAAAEFPVEKKLRAKLLIFWSRLWYENVLIGDFRVSDVPCLPLLATWSRPGRQANFRRPAVSPGYAWW